MLLPLLPDQRAHRQDDDRLEERWAKTLLPPGRGGARTSCASDGAVAAAARVALGGHSRRDAEVAGLDRSEREILDAERRERDVRAIGTAGVGQKAVERVDLETRWSRSAL